MEKYQAGETILDGDLVYLKNGLLFKVKPKRKKLPPRKSN